MKCDKMFEIIPQLLNGALPKEEEAQALGHLMQCESCRRELAFWTKVSDAQAVCEKEFSNTKRESIFAALTEREQTAVDITKQAVKVYFKVIESILNF
jgi:anti-sigma factor RsiW